MKKTHDEDIYKTIVENLGVEIFVSDGEGNVLFVNPSSIEINELDVDNVVGRNVRELMEDGYFEESSTLKVLKEKIIPDLAITFGQNITVRIVNTSGFVVEKGTAPTKPVSKDSIRDILLEHIDEIV